MFALRRLASTPVVRSGVTLSAVAAPLGVTIGARAYATKEPPPLARSALEGNPQKLVNDVPPVEVKGARVACDGGGGPLGHPKVYINLNVEDGPAVCGYCGLRFVQKH
eukprot:GFYU01008671.1.p1 GENE.GFYU01008671.1~~GFYU01008671.1.p1  ORF type:complete len:118 (+),score=33.30 GFYU01008671.1:32-355(+)